MSILILLSIVLYIVPTVVALARKHRQIGAIFILNLFLGWTVLGWVGALVWAVTVGPEQPRLPDAAPGA